MQILNIGIKMENWKKLVNSHNAEVYDIWLESEIILYYLLFKM